MKPEKPPAPDIRGRTAAGATVMIASRLITRAIDFVALIVLARLLSPADFGLVAIAMSVIVIVEAIMELPLGFALVALPTRTKAHYDTVFTLQLMRGFGLAAILLVSTWPLSQIYDDHRLIWLIAALSVAPASRGLTSPRVIEFSINFDFLPNLTMEVVGKLVALALSVGCAWLTRSYWSLAVGTIASPVTMLIVSYIYAPYLPVISLGKWRDFSTYVRWTTFGQTISALIWQMDPLMLGRFVNRFELGGFSMATQLAALPGQIFITQMMNPLVVAFSSVRNDVKRLTTAYQKSATSMLALSLPIMVGMSMNAEPIIRLAFGEQWSGAGEILRWFALTIVPSLLVGPLPPLAVSMERSPVITRLLIVEIILKFPLMLAGIWYYGIFGAIAARMFMALVIAVCALLTVRQLIGLRVSDQLLGAWRPAASVAVMAVVIAPLIEAFGDASGYYALLLHFGLIVSAGAVAYTGAMFVLWSLAGRPDGLESHIITLLAKILSRVRRVTP
jgi:O-antigen/teichoic acid export membrane protein